MSLIKELSGSWTWDGTTTVLADNTSEVVATDRIQMESRGRAFEIESIVPNVSVTIKNPESIPIQSGSGAFLSQEWIRNEIQAAVDVAIAETWENITEPSTPPGTKRILRQDYSSATIQVGKIYRIDYSYVHPASDPAWGALSGIEESIV